MLRCKLFQFIISLFLLFQTVTATESITGMNQGYREICRKAIFDAYYFQNFRSFPEYIWALELEDGEAFAKYVLSSKRLMGKLEDFRTLDSIGNPRTSSYPGLGAFSGTTLRYIALADDIQGLFDLPKNPTIVEIGAGFGGQCYILSQIQPFSKYYIYDLPEVEALISKTMNAFSVQNVVCMPMEADLPEGKVDLLISNYAFSACGRKIQLDYFEKIIKKADRGYLMYNQIAKEVFGIDSLSAAEFVQLLKDNGKNPKTYNELISTHPDNVLIVWDCQ